jgi:hypothetical protein
MCLGFVTDGSKLRSSRAATKLLAPGDPFTKLGFILIVLVYNL